MADIKTQKANFLSYAARVEQNPKDTAGNAGPSAIAEFTQTKGIRERQVIITTEEAQTLARLTVGNASMKANPNGSKVMGDIFDAVVAKDSKVTLRDATREQLIEFVARDELGGVKEKFKLTPTQIETMGEVAADYAKLAATAKVNAAALEAVIEKLPNKGKFDAKAAQEVNVILGKNPEIATAFAEAVTAGTPEKATEAMDKAVDKLPPELKKTLGTTPVAPEPKKDEKKIEGLDLKKPLDKAKGGVDSLPPVPKEISDPAKKAGQGK